MVATRSVETRRDEMELDRPEPREDGHAARAINGRIRLPKELTAIWSASTLPACRLDPPGE
jgi:hypothetical protein